MLARPNPIGGTTFEGPIQDDDLVGKFTSFKPMTTTHGMTVGELAKKAVVAKPPDRARLYGLFLATCASCHQMVRGPAGKAK